MVFFVHTLFLHVYTLHVHLIVFEYVQAIHVPVPFEKQAYFEPA